MSRKTKKKKATLQKNIAKVKELLPPELKTRKLRMEHVRARVNANITPKERQQLVKAQDKRLRYDVVTWTVPYDKAAYMVAEGRLPLREIAEKTNISLGKLTKMISVNGEFC